MSEYTFKVTGTIAEMLEAAMSDNVRNGLNAPKSEFLRQVVAASILHSVLKAGTQENADPATKAAVLPLAIKARDENYGVNDVCEVFAPVPVEGLTKRELAAFVNGMAAANTGLDYFKASTELGFGGARGSDDGLLKTVADELMVRLGSTSKYNTDEEA
jgi:hypothetical protein